MLGPAQGRPLREAIREEPASAPQWVDELVCLVAALHAQGLVLSAVRPEDVVVQRNGHVGLTRLETLPTLTEFGDDDWPFVAPEAAQGQPVGPRSDVYSLGQWLEEAGGNAELVKRAKASAALDRFEDARALAVALRQPQATSVDTEIVDRLLEVARDKATELRDLKQRAQWVAGTGDDATLWRVRDRTEHVWSEIGGIGACLVALAPDDPRGRRMLADLAYRRAKSAEQRADHLALEQNLEALAEYDDGRHAEYLHGEGLVSVYTEPAGATITLFQNTPHGAAFTQARRGLPQRSPLERVKVSAGSWEARIERRGFISVRYPFFVARGQEWDPTPPESLQPAAIPLPPAELVDEDEVFVPGGWARLGGDRDAPGSGRARWIWVDDFLIQREPITHEMFLEFLNDLVRQRRIDDVERAQPRHPSTSKGAPLYVKGFANALDLPSRTEGMIIEAKQPVVCIDRQAAEQFALWYAVRTGKRWRLPSEAEWEKAARGVDARLFPWGPTFDNHRCVTAERRLRSCPVVHDLTTDESPYGVIAMAGGVREWTSSAWDPSGIDAETSGYAKPGTKLTDEPVPLVARGSSFLESRDLARCASRHRVEPHSQMVDLGFRLARPLPTGNSSVPSMRRVRRPDER